MVVAAAVLAATVLRLQKLMYAYIVFLVVVAAELRLYSTYCCY